MHRRGSATCSPRRRPNANAQGRDGTYDISVSNADGTVVATFVGRSKEIGGALFEAEP